VRGRYFSAYRGLPGEIYYLFAAKLVNCMGFFIMPLLTLILTQKLGMAKADAGSMVTMLAVTQAPCVILGGRFADKLGRKKTLIAGSAAGALFYLLCALFPMGKATVVFIILAADMSALAAPSLDAMLADIAAPADRQRAFSLLYLGANIGMTVSPIVGGLLFKNHLPLLFIMDAATTGAAAAIVLLRVKEHFRRPEETPPEEDGPPADSLARTLKANLVLPAFLALLFLYDFCYSQWNFLLPAQFGDRYAGDGARFYSYLTSANALTVIFMTPVVTSLVSRLRPLTAVAIGGGLFCAAYLCFGTGGTFPVYIAAAELFTLGEISETIQVGAYLANSVPGSLRGRMTSLSTIARGAGWAVGPVWMGDYLTRAGYAASWHLTAAVVFAAAACMLLLSRKSREPRCAAD